VFNKLILTPILFFAVVGAAADMPENAVITNKYREIPINSVTGAAVVVDRSQFVTEDEYEYVNIDATIEFYVHIEGNLCLGSFETTSKTANFIADRYVRISLGTHYASDPYSPVLQGCTAHSAPRNIIVPERLMGSADANNPFIRKYSFATSRWAGDPDGKIYIVEVIYDFAARSFLVHVTLQD